MFEMINVSCQWSHLFMYSGRERLNQGYSSVVLRVLVLP